MDKDPYLEYCWRTWGNVVRNMNWNQLRTMYNREGIGQAARLEMACRKMLLMG